MTSTDRNNTMTTTPTRFRKRPVEIEAVQWTGDNFAEISEFTEGYFRNTTYGDGRPARTEVRDYLHGSWIALDAGDWIVRGPRGECYPVRADVFTETYEPVDSEVPFEGPTPQEDPDAPYRYEIEVWYPGADGSHTWEKGKTTAQGLADRLRSEIKLIQIVGGAE